MLNVSMTNAISYFCKEWAILFKKIKTLKIFSKQLSKPVSKKLLFKNGSIFPNVNARGVYFLSQINPYSNHMVIRQHLCLKDSFWNLRNLWRKILQFYIIKCMVGKAETAAGCTLVNFFYWWSKILLYRNGIDKGG